MSVKMRKNPITGRRCFFDLFTDQVLLTVHRCGSVAYPVYRYNLHVGNVSLKVRPMSIKNYKDVLPVMVMDPLLIVCFWWSSCNYLK